MWFPDTVRYLIIVVNLANVQEINKVNDELFLENWRIWHSVLSRNTLSLCPFSYNAVSRSVSKGNIIDTLQIMFHLIRYTLDWLQRNLHIKFCKHILGTLRKSSNTSV